MGSSSKVYFATRSKAEIGQHLVSRLERARNDENECGVRDEERNAYRHYYGHELGLGVTSGVQRDGQLGELAAVRINKARALAKAYVALVLGPKLAWRPMARNADADAQKATVVSTHLLEDLWKNKGLSRVIARWVEQGLVFASGYVFPEWDRSAGESVAPIDGRLVLTGDITFHNVLPWDVFRDAKARSPEHLGWHFVRVPKNRYDLAKLYPTLSGYGEARPSLEAILNAGDPLAAAGEETLSEEEVWVYHFFHRPTPSLPAGREVVFLDANCILRDGRLSYDEVPLYRLAADEMFGTVNAWSAFWDTLGAQELLDGIETALATNITNLGGQSIAMEQGSEIAPDHLANGMRVIRYPKGGKPPAGVQLVQQPREAFEHIESISSAQRSLMGLNDVALGQPDTAQMNAQAFAVLASMAVQQASPFQGAVVDAVSRLGTGVLKTLRRRVTRERTLQVVGRTSKHLFSERTYSGKDLAPVQRVLVEIGNPLEQTPSGRAVILEHYMQLGFIRSPELYQQVVETGRLEPATRADRDEALLLAAEYEQLSEGEAPTVHAVQNHPLHFRENAAVLHNPENLRSPEVVAAVQAHLDAHYLEFFGVVPQQDPLFADRIRLMLGQQPPGAAQMMGAPGAPMPPGGPEGAPLPPGEMPAAPAPLAPPEAPALPDNPLTGEQFAPAGPPIGPVSA